MAKRRYAVAFLGQVGDVHALSVLRTTLHCSEVSCLNDARESAQRSTWRAFASASACVACEVGEAPRAAGRAGVSTESGAFRLV
jgi:hypothetical protein